MVIHPGVARAPKAMNSLIKSRLIRHMADRKASHNIIKRGFTLVELMVVIVIVGILSAVALPNFLSQSAKAKGTEAKSTIASIIKSAQADYHTEGAAAVSEDCTTLGGPEDDVQKFNYVCSITGEEFTVTATANENDPAIQGNAVAQKVDFSTGVVTLDKATTNKMFGGDLANAGN